jgi:hypothetical protein
LFIVRWYMSVVYCPLVYVRRAGTQRQHITEVWLQYYDIFTRHAFGNIRDVVRDVAYSPMMGEFLTHKNNKAYAAAGTFPDENFAREVMQLFTLGLHKLNLDGTPILGEDGDPLPAYDNDDITTFARIWTGFAIAGSWRSNTEGMVLGGDNVADPMKIKSAWRDRFPKTKLNAGYIGDKYPLCADLPPRPFLSKGATFRYLGEFSAGGSGYDNPTHKYNRFELSSDSALYEELCQGDSSGVCTFPDQVVLGKLLNCTGNECRVDYVAGVKIVKAGITGWYEYIRPPCVRLALTESGFWTKYSFRQTLPSYQCADPHAPVGAGVCCNSITGAAFVTRDRSGRFNEFQEEYVQLATLQKRCEAKNMAVCDDHRLSSGNVGSCRESHMWTKQPCRPQIQVHANGWINLVATPPAGGRVHTSFGLNSPEVFRLWWEGDAYPKYKDGCGEGCTQAAGDTCLCDIAVETRAAFDEPTRVPTVAELNAKLFIGSVAPDTLNNELDHGKAYRACTSAICTANAEVAVHVKEPPARAESKTGSESSGELPALVAIASTQTGSWKAENAVDGDRSSTSIFHSGWGKNKPWIQLDLGVRRAIQEVVIYHRGGMGRDLFKYHELWISDDASTPREMCYNSTGGSSSTTWNLPCVGIGRYVRISLPQPDRTLMILEVEVKSAAAPSSAPTNAPSSAPTRVDASLLMDTATIFEYRSAITGKLVYLRNEVSTIRVGRNFSFRNPPHFMPLLGENSNNNPFDQLAAKRDAEYEVEALIDHLTQHPSVAPHISKLLIQRFTTSNPSPRYVKVVATAFTTGTYAGKTFSGVHGDLGATIIALVSDREARSTTLDADITYGSIREPFLKVIHFLRAFDYKAYFGSMLAMPSLLSRVGMDAFGAPGEPSLASSQCSD